MSRNRKGEKDLHGTTILVLRKDSKTVMAGDGQVTYNDTIFKTSARKVRKIFNDKILVGFSGATADALTLLERFESKIQEYSGNITRAAVELAKEWRTDKALRRLEAMLLIADTKKILVITGAGDVIEPDEPVMAIGSGGNFSLAAAKALLRFSNLSAEQIVLESMKISSEISIYSNSNFIVETLVEE